MGQFPIGGPLDPSLCLHSLETVLLSLRKVLVIG